MTIQKLDKKRVLISLKTEDINTYSINIDKLSTKDDSSKGTLKALLYQACKRTGISTDNKAALVEAMPYKDGLLILITIDDKKNLRKTYRIKRPETLLCFRFKDTDSLLSCINQSGSLCLSFPKNSLWLYQKSYYLVFESPKLTEKFKRILSEFSAQLNISKITFARIRETGKLLSDGNAAAEIHAACKKQN